MIDQIFREFSAKKLRQLFSRIHSCLDRLSEEQIWARGTKNENAIGNLVLHLNGNVRQWILTGVAGHPDRRDRDAEFAERGGVPKTELLGRLDATLDEAIRVIESLDAERLQQRTSVQKYEVTVLEAVAHVVEHFAQHTGQIIFATKLLTGEDLGFYKHLSGATHTAKTP
jgi:uncharacterized damage-inducible protein DinB